ncbi:hypothetical protein H4219_000800 [Mycoemilia scoparia]|uniref:Uncharacterized protein n=1 Tax=Mycoemilia scoparia TaxID=417184 RepID=A0A9W8A1X2_9FUNG|nr:hypothetical protein H4219_000800 [Mycoemilia scoparia]
MKDFEEAQTALIEAIQKAWSWLNDSGYDIAKDTRFDEESPVAKALYSSLPVEELKGTGDSSSRMKTHCEIAFTQIVYSFVQKLSSEFESSSSNDSINRLYSLLDLAIGITELNLGDGIFAWIMLEHAMKLASLKLADHIFGFIESRSLILVANIDPRYAKGQTMIRTCNDLLKRLSHSYQTTLRGRVHVFIDNCTTLSDRSGINIAGQHNLANSTEYEKDIGEIPRTLDIFENKNLADLYSRFWSLQSCFVEPSRIFSEYGFSKYEENMRVVLENFREAAETRAPSAESSVLQNSTSDYNGNRLLFSKYLTCPKLFEHELLDPHFRCQFLTQALIVCRHLLGVDKNLKESMKQDKSVNPMVIHSFELTDSQIRSIKAIRERIVQQLGSTQLFNGHFGICAFYVNRHEKYWVEWKDEKCPVNELAPSPDKSSEMSDALDWFNTPKSPNNVEITLMGSKSHAKLCDTNLKDPSLVQGYHLDLSSAEDYQNKINASKGNSGTSEKPHNVDEWKLSRAIMAQNVTMLCTK